MLTESTLSELRTFTIENAPPVRRGAFVGAIDDLQRTIAAQSLTIRNLTAELRNRRISQEAMEAIVPTETLNDILTRLGEPKQTPFSLAEARTACADLAEESARATDITHIAATIVKVVRAFL